MIRCEVDANAVGKNCDRRCGVDRGIAAGCRRFGGGPVVGGFVERRLPVLVDTGAIPDSVGSGIARDADARAGFPRRIVVGKFVGQRRFLDLADTGAIPDSGGSGIARRADTRTVFTGRIVVGKFVGRRGADDNAPDTGAIPDPGGSGIARCAGTRTDSGARTKPGSVAGSDSRGGRQ